MVKKNSSFLRKWEISLLLALCVTLCAGIWARAQQRELASGLVRLHVVAASDSEEDQALKLAVRDEVLALLEPVLDGTSGRDDALAEIENRLPELETLAADIAWERGMDYGAAVTLCAETYPTKEYDGFSLPAGEYMSLRVALGEGEGKNWWCVVFPPLCMAAAEDTLTSAATGLSEDELSLITEENDGYALKFKLMEIWGDLKEKWG